VNGEGDVYGRITYLNGTGVEGAAVSIEDDDMKTTTDNDGYYIFYNVPTGNKELKVEKDGYNTYIKKVFVRPSNSDLNWDDPNTEDDESNNGNEHNFEIVVGDETIERGSYPPWGLISGVIVVCAVLFVIFSIIAMLGGYFAIKRRKFGLAITGSILGIFTLVGAIFAIPALFILILSRDEFRRESKVDDIL
jgi:hypothetical protein